MILVHITLLVLGSLVTASSPNYRQFISEDN